MSDRTRRALRILDLRKRAADVAQQALATAAAAARNRRDELEHAERAWSARADEPVAGTVADAIEAHAELAFLSHERRRKLESARDAERAEDSQRAAALDAQKEVRRFELWQDSMARAEREVVERTEQRVTDEHAARKSKA